MVSMLAITSLILSGEPPARLSERVPEALVSFEMVRVPAGELVRPDGSRVAVKSFYMMTTEVTWDLFGVYAFRRDMTDEERAANADADSRPSKPYGEADRGFGFQGYPAIGMTFQSAEAFTKWLNKKTGKAYRFPTADEWSYAALAGGSAPEFYDDFAWFLETTEGTTRPVGTKKPNGWGIYDLYGNAAEWVPHPDGKGAVMGGHFNSPSTKVGPFAMEPYVPAWQRRDAQIPKSRWWLSDGPFTGIRLVLDVTE